MKYAFKKKLPKYALQNIYIRHQEFKKKFKKFPQMTFVVVDGVRHICDKVFFVPSGFEIKKS
jgi:hypothetical protein